MAGKLVSGMLAAMAVFVLLAFVSIWHEKHRKRQEYDERQEQIQGKAAVFALLLGSCYYLGLFAAMTFAESLPLPESTLLILGLCLQLLSYHLYCLVRGIGLPLNQAGWTMPALYGFNGITQFILFRNNMGYLEAYRAYSTVEPNHTLPAPGDGASLWLQLIMAVTFIAMAVIYLIPLLREERE